MVEKQTNVEQSKSLNQLIVMATHILTNLRTLCKVSDLKHKFGKMRHLYAYVSYESFLLSLISGSQKKAKTFDFMAIFQEARQRTLCKVSDLKHKFGKMRHLYAYVSYESFLLSLISGSQKKAKTFDFMAIFQEARQTAIDRTQTSRGKDWSLIKENVLDGCDRWHQTDE